MKTTHFLQPARRSPGAAVPPPPGRAALAIGLLALLAGCDDPFEIDWVSTPENAVIYSLSRPEPNLPSGFNFHFRSAVLVESPGSTGQWDVALDTEDGQLVFLPPRALGINSRARIAPLSGLEFQEVVEAPQDTAAYVSDRALPVTPGTIYVVQTGEGIGTFGQRCVFFAKLEPVDIDVTGGQLTFVFDANPVCNDPRLVPPEG
jgi:hypothetical protein